MDVLYIARVHTYAYDNMIMDLFVSVVYDSAAFRPKGH